MFIESRIVNFFSHMFDSVWIRRMSDIYGNHFFALIEEIQRNDSLSSDLNI